MSVLTKINLLGYVPERL